MPLSSVESLKIKAKLLQKAKKRKGEEFALKDAYLAIAKAAGYPSWKAMKDAYEESDVFNPPHWSAQWKVWFSSKAEALSFAGSSRGYILPYRGDFFVCDANYLLALGIQEEDPDLTKVGKDWCRPKDMEAWSSLIKKIKRAHEEG